MTRCLVLRFAAPLQSWGTSGFALRNTEVVPTRSGVTGLMAACLGARRGEYPTWLDDCDIWVRVERPGHQEEDFHTVNPPEPAVAASRGRTATLLSGKHIESVGHSVTTGDGSAWLVGNRVNPLVTRRRYLADAEFLVALSHPIGSRVTDLALAARTPVFLPYLGRKACRPTFPFYLGLHNGAPQDVLKALPATHTRALPLHHITGDRNECVSRATPPQAASEDEAWKEWIRR